MEGETERVKDREIEIIGRIKFVLKGEIKLLVLIIAVFFSCDLSVPLFQ